MRRSEFFRTLCAAVLIAAMTGGSGCMKKDDTADRIQRYLEERYDDRFSDINIFGGYPGTSVHRYQVHSERFSGVFAVEVYDRGEASERMYDSYLALKFERETRELITGILAKKAGVTADEVQLSGGANISATISWGSEKTELREYVSDPSSGIMFSASIEVPGAGEAHDAKEQPEADITEEGLIKAFVDEGICCTGTVYLVEEGTVGEANLKELIDTRGYSERLHFYAEPESLR